jgi:hypothetical protein
VTLPDFLVVGAMKSGTTSLYRDLLVNPSIFMPVDKEPNDLLSDDVHTADGLEDYARQFQRAQPDQRCGEASTAYTMLPRYKGVPQRAREVLGPDCKIIYLVREPVDRIVSHHHHASMARRFEEHDINQAIRLYPQLLDYTRYAMQIEPWIDVMGAQNVRILRSDVYREQRLETIEQLSQFIGVEPRTDLIDVDTVYNRSDGKPVMKGPFAAVQRSRPYRSFVRPLLSIGIKDRLRRVLLPSAPVHDVPPSAQTIAYIYAELANDLQRLGELMGLDGPPWHPPE